MVFYLKYRPKSFKELDSQKVRERLVSFLSGRLPLASKSKRGDASSIPHAFLFTGPKGLGKTSTARIIARAVNCTNRKSVKDIEPCNKCNSCRSILEGTSLDVLEIDGASNRGIDEIRDLREKIRLSPVSSFMKVYIIDEVHMLTTEAFNALLKTLEEPPSHAIFILCTTDPQKVPATITSRCFTLSFEKASLEDLVHSFNRIVKGEGIVADPQALEAIARRADSSFRDGAKILEEVASGSKKITTKIVEEKLNTQIVSSNIDSFLNSLLEQKTGESFTILEKLENEKADFKFFIEELIQKVHSEMIDRLSKGGDTQKLKELIERLNKAYLEQRYTFLPQIPLELLVMDFVKSDKETVPETIKDYPESGDKNDKILKDLIEKVKNENYSIAGILRGCKIVNIDKGKMSIMTNYKFHKEKLSDSKVMSLLEKMAGDFFGEKTKINVMLSGGDYK